MIGALRTAGSNDIFGGIVTGLYGEFCIGRQAALGELVGRNSGALYRRLFDGTGTAKNNADGLGVAA